MPNQALFIFEGTLKDFLSSSEKTVAFDFLGNPSVKDAIEAQGVPHVEVTEILINQNPVPLSYKLQSGDEIQVYPYSPKHWSSILKNPIKFIVDGHLGKLAKDLRTWVLIVSMIKTIRSKPLPTYPKTKTGLS